MGRRKDYWRDKTDKVDGPLLPSVWYRSSLWHDDHLPGLSKAFQEEELAWCGRPLGIARDYVDSELGGLWMSDRKGGKCAECSRREEEIHAAK